MHKRILYCVLDWGLGHATRSIPVIRTLLDRECDVVLASDSLALEFLRAEFPTLPTYELAPYSVEYTTDNILLNGIKNWKNIRTAIKAEHSLMRGIVRKEKIDAIISDNRYGCHITDLPSVLITHQLQFCTGNRVQDGIGKIAVQKLIKPFDRIWIPDDLSRTLSGVLSSSNDQRVRCIGWQSTLRRGDAINKYAIAAILSGPEPKRTAFENEVVHQLSTLNLKCVLVRGIQGNRNALHKGNIVVYDVLDRNGINQAIDSASIVLCRSGYSSLMDLMATGKKAILIPTPGQPEQIYLGNRMKLISNYVVQQQVELNIKAAMSQLDDANLIPVRSTSSDLLENAITDFFSLC